MASRTEDQRTVLKMIGAVLLLAAFAIAMAVVINIVV
jgi:hypothetical protein